MSKAIILTHNRLASFAKMSNPSVPTAEAISAKTPTGAVHITTLIHQIKASSRPSIDLEISSFLSFATVPMPKPSNIQKTIICKILPSTKATTGLAGIKLSIVCQKPSSCVVVVSVPWLPMNCSTTSGDTPLPG